MSQAETTGPGLHLTLSIWHPNCWTLEVTEQTSGGMLAHAVYNASDDTVKGLFTAYGDNNREVDELIEATRASPLTSAVLELEERYGTSSYPAAPGNTTRELFVEYDNQHTMSHTLLSHGFIHNEPVRVRHGREYWPVFFQGTREQIEDHLDEIREEKEADIKVTRISTAGGSQTAPQHRMDRLSESQREAFELARNNGYYAWPRGISTRELAEKLDISKTTLLEHLRKAEAKLLNPDH